MQTLPPVPEGFTRASEYPKFSRNEGSDAATDKFFIRFDDFEYEMIEQMESLYFGDLTVNDVSAEPDAAQHMMYVTVKYGQPGIMGLSSAADGQDEWTLDDSGMELPIDKRKSDGKLLFPKYRTCHNYKLAAATPEAAASSDWHAWWPTATDTTVSSANYRWVKEDDSLPEGWRIVKDKTKNIETVLYPSAVVVGTSRYRNYAAASAKRKKPGTKDTPKKTFDITGEWLVVSSSISKDGRRWVVTTRYQNAPEWDNTYYGGDVAE